MKGIEIHLSVHLKYFFRVNKCLDSTVERVEVEENFSLSAFIFAVSLFLVSENCVAMTTKQRFIMKNDPT